MPGRLCVFGNQLCTCPDDDTISSACGRTARLRSRVNDRAQSNGYPRYQVLESPIDLRDNDSNVRQVFFSARDWPDRHDRSLGTGLAVEPVRSITWNQRCTTSLSRSWWRHRRMASKHSKVTEISLDTVWLPTGIDLVRTVLR